jgi:hypothetical protein
MNPAFSGVCVCVVVFNGSGQNKKAPESSDASWPLRLYLKLGIFGWVMPVLLVFHYCNVRADAGPPPKEKRKYLG